VTVLGQHLADDRFGVLHLGGIVLPFLREADLFFLEAVEQVGLRDCAQPGVINFADGGLFRHEDVEDDTLLGVFALQAEIFEIAGVPQRIEVALDGNGIVVVADVGKQARQDGFFGDAAVADDADLVNGLGLLGKRSNAGQCDHQEDHQPTQTAERNVLPYHRVFAPRRAQKRKVRSMVQIHAKNLHTLITGKVVLPSRKS